MLVRTTIQDRICYVEMQNGEHFNCLSEEMCREVSEAIRLGYEKECVGIVLKAQCNKGVWSAGHDIRELPQTGDDPLAYNVPMEKLLRCVQDTPIPVIACVDGTVWGGACDLCLSCDMIVSSDKATFAITPAKIGIPYNASGILHFINQLGMNIGNDSIRPERTKEWELGLEGKFLNNRAGFEVSWYNKKIVDQILALPERTRLMILAPVVRGRKGEFAKLLEDMGKVTQFVGGEVSQP